MAFAEGAGDAGALQVGKQPGSRALSGAKREDAGSVWRGKIGNDDITEARESLFEPFRVSEDSGVALGFGSRKDAAQTLTHSIKSRIIEGASFKPAGTPPKRHPVTQSLKGLPVVTEPSGTLGVEFVTEISRYVGEAGSPRRNEPFGAADRGKRHRCFADIQGEGTHALYRIHKEMDFVLSTEPGETRKIYTVAGPEMDPIHGDGTGARGHDLQNRVFQARQIRRVHDPEANEISQEKPDEVVCGK